MKKLVNLILMTLAATLVLSVGQLNHVSAMPDQSGMVGVSDHGNSTSYGQHCSVSHMGTMAKIENQRKDIKKHNDKDDEPRPPYFLQFACSNLTAASSREFVYTPPEDSIKVPLYRLYGVVRR